MNEALTLAAHLARKSPETAPHLIARDVLALSRLARTLQGYAERDCNQGLTAAHERTRDRMTEQAREIAQRYGLNARTCGDPRGHSLRLIGLPGNSWGGDADGFGISG
jgi:hypothetical protein